MNSYQQEQLKAHQQLSEYLDKLDPAAIDGLNDAIGPYLKFRRKLKGYMDEHLGEHCNQACFESQTSACCSKDGIITFWADLVVNRLCAGRRGHRSLVAAIENPVFPNKCIYLGKDGCRWEISPLVCAMFVCDTIRRDVIDTNSVLSERWDRFAEQAKGFRWPDRPVLFDHLEEVFMGIGCRSSLMYINTSPGLLRIKRTNLK